MDRFRNVKVLHLSKKEEEKKSNEVLEQLHLNYVLPPNDPALLDAYLEPFDFVLGGQREDKAEHRTGMMIVRQRSRTRLAIAIRFCLNEVMLLQLAEEHIVVVMV